MSDLSNIEPVRHSGAEPIRDGERNLDFDLLSFWQWGFSDVISNATRGVLAEYLVARAFGVADGVREEWAAYDLVSPRGVRVEVKSAAFVQNWGQAKLSTVLFAYPKTRAWDSATNTLSHEKRRHADVYVFALLAHTDKASLDPLDVSQWQFFVVPTEVLNRRTRSQRSITPPSLRKLAGAPVAYHDLGRAIVAAADFPTANTQGVQG